MLCRRISNSSALKPWAFLPQKKRGNSVWLLSSTNVFPLYALQIGGYQPGLGVVHRKKRAIIAFFSAKRHMNI
jgi:hypothetical protein